MNIPDRVRSLLLQEKYWKNPECEFKKVAVSVIPHSIYEHQRSPWVELKNTYYDGEEINGFFIFEARRIGFQDDLAVLRYFCRKSLYIQLSLLRLDSGVWSLHLLL